ncbi:hypothetical protein [Kitasatospora sp. NPDC088779]|uniref:hypothetical protein n=1 Tax=unclassified Kitasatospora TaxID=2633591 RepID=UPI00344995E6
MIKKVLRALTRATSQPGTASNGPGGRPLYRWRCECGAQSRDSDIKFDTEHNASRHQWRHGVDHPMPEVYGTGETEIWVNP